MNSVVHVFVVCADFLVLSARWFVRPHGPLSSSYVALEHTSRLRGVKRALPWEWRMWAMINHTIFGIVDHDEHIPPSFVYIHVL